MIRSGDLRAGRPKFSFGPAGADGPLRLVEPRSVTVSYSRIVTVAPIDFDAFAPGSALQPS
jgi:hypothetical protein